jgi:hypothetical protein
MSSAPDATTTAKRGPVDDMWRVDIAGVSVLVRGEAAKDHLEKINRERIRMKLSLNKIRWRDDQAGDIARKGLGL